MTGHDTSLLAGKSLLIVEEDMALARRMCTRLAACGAHIVGPAPTVHYARLIIGRRRLDGAILDMAHPRTETRAFAEMLLGRGVPILIANGPDDQGSPPETAQQTDATAFLEGLVGRVAEMTAGSTVRLERAPDPPPLAPSALLSVQERFARAIASGLRADLHHRH